MKNVYRYIDSSTMFTKLDPLDDVVSWIRGLKSLGYTTDLLRSKHGFTDKNKINAAAVDISTYVESSVQLLDQGQASTIELSFLPKYYALMNLAKATIVFGGMHQSLTIRENRKHGGSWPGTSVKNFFSDSIHIYPKGVIPLLYQVLVGQQIPLNKQNAIRLGDIYSYIFDINYEYGMLANRTINLAHCNVNLTNGDAPNEYKLAMQIFNRNNTETTNKRNIPLMSNLNKLPNQATYISAHVIAQSEREAIQKLRNQFAYYLLYWPREDLCLTPKSRSSILMPEEFPILLAFFHLSNVVRYNPLLLKKLFDSPMIGLLDALARHALYRYLVLFWSYVNQTTYFIKRM